MREEELKNLFLRASDVILSDIKNLHNLRTVRAELELCQFSRDGSSLIVSGLPEDRLEYYQDRYKTSFEKLFVGLLGEEVMIDFTGSGDAIPI